MTERTTVVNSAGNGVAIVMMIVVALLVIV